MAGAPSQRIGSHHGGSRPTKISPCSWRRKQEDNSIKQNKTDTMKTIKFAIAAFALTAMPFAAFAGKACDKCCKDKGKECAACCKDAGKECGKDCCKEKEKK